MPDVSEIAAGIGGAMAAFLGGAVAAWRALRVPAPPREPMATLPPVSQQPSPHDPRLEQLEDRVEAEARRAQDFREAVLVKLARIFTRLRIKEEQDDGD